MEVSPSPASIPRSPGPERRDAELVRRIARGDRTALGELFDRHADAALGLAHRILGNRQDAEDLVHDVFLEAWSRAASYDPRRARVRAWLLVRIRSRAIDRLRALEVARRHAMAEAARPDPPQAAHVSPEAASEAARARGALQALGADQRSVIELAYFEGLTLREVAEREGIPVGTVKSRLGAALAVLRRQLGAGALASPAATGEAP